MCGARHGQGGAHAPKGALGWEEAARPARGIQAGSPPTRRDQGSLSGGLWLLQPSAHQACPAPKGDCGKAELTRGLDPPQSSLRGCLLQPGLSVLEETGPRWRVALGRAGGPSTFLPARPSQLLWAKVLPDTLRNQINQMGSALDLSPRGRVCPRRVCSTAGNIPTIRNVPNAGRVPTGRVPMQGVSPQGLSVMQGTLQGVRGGGLAGGLHGLPEEAPIEGAIKASPPSVSRSTGPQEWVSLAPPLNQTTTLFPKSWKHHKPVTRFQGRCSECLTLCVLGGGVLGGRGPAGAGHFLGLGGSQLSPTLTGVIVLRMPS